MDMLTGMLAIAERELAVRQRVYPKWIELRLIEPATARRRLTYMAVIAETLRRMIEAGRQPGLFD